MPGSIEEMDAEPITTRFFGTQPQKNPQPGLDALNASGWYGQLRGLISPYHWLTLNNYHSNLSTYGTLLKKNAPSSG